MIPARLIKLALVLSLLAGCAGARKRRPLVDRAGKYYQSLESFYNAAKLKDRRIVTGRNFPKKTSYRKKKSSFNHLAETMLNAPSMRF